MALKVAVWGRKGTRKVLRVLVGGLGFLFGLLIKLLSVHLIKKKQNEKKLGVSRRNTRPGPGHLGVV